MKKRINSKQKGKAVEREAVKFLTSMGFPCHRTAQNRGKTGDCADIEFEDEKFPLHVEVKGVNGMRVDTLELVRAIEQAKRDASVEDPPKFPVVLWWEHRLGWRLSWTLDSVVVVTVGQSQIKEGIEFLLKEIA